MPKNNPEVRLLFADAHKDKNLKKTKEEKEKEKEKKEDEKASKPLGVMSLPFSLEVVGRLVGTFLGALLYEVTFGTSRHRPFGSKKVAKPVVKDIVDDDKKEFTKVSGDIDFNTDAPLNSDMFVQNSPYCADAIGVDHNMPETVQGIYDLSDEVALKLLEILKRDLPTPPIQLCLDAKLCSIKEQLILILKTLNLQVAHGARIYKV